MYLTPPQKFHQYKAIQRSGLKHNYTIVLLYKNWFVAYSLSPTREVPNVNAKFVQIQKGKYLFKLVLFTFFISAENNKDKEMFALLTKKLNE